MASRFTSESPAAPARGAVGAVRRFAGPFGEILAAARAAHTRAEFFRAALRAVAQYFQSPYAALTLRLPSEAIEEEAHVGPTDPNFWKPNVQAFLSETLSQGRARAQLLSARKADLRLALIAAPLHLPDGESAGALALVLKLNADDARARVALVESLVALMSGAADLVGRADSGGPAPTASVAPETSAARAAAMESVEQLALALTTSLRNRFDCQQVSLALVHGPRVELVSISGLDRILGRNPGVKLIQAALEECVDHGRPVRLDAEHTEPAFRLHAQWRAAVGGAAVASIPLRIGPRIAAVVGLRRAPERTFSNEHLAQIQAAIEPFSAALWLVRDARRGLVRHGLDACRAQWRAISGPGHAARKVAVALAALLLAWFCFGTLQHRVAAPCRIVAAGARQIAMPLDGRLVDVHALPGDRRKAGEVLAVLDTRELELEAEALRAEREAAEVMLAGAQAAQRPVEARLSQARLTQLRAQLEIVTARIERATIRAPFDGLVVAGDLRPRIGEPLPRGTTLLEFAPGDRWSLELEIPPGDAADLQDGLVGRFAGLARPEDAHAFTLTRVRPGAEARAGRTVYVAEATPEAAADWMRAGLEGVARIEVGPRRVWWWALRPVLDPLRMNFWL